MSPETRYRLRPSVETFTTASGTLCFLRPGDEDLVVRSPEAGDVALVRALAAGPRTAAELGADVGIDGPALSGKLESLVAAGLVIVAHDAPGDPLPGEEEERFSRQLPYLAELGDERALQRRLRASTVAVLGCGGIGTWALAATACLGVGRLVLADDDRVDLSNLNRQILYGRSDVGGRKVDVAAAWVRRLDPAIEVKVIDHRVASVTDAESIVAGADAVVLAADWPPYELARWVNSACVATRTPFVTAGQVPPLLKIGPAYVPGAGACFACHETMLRARSTAYDDYVASRRAAPATASTLGPASAVAGGLIALELLQLLLGRLPATASETLVLDIRTLAVRREPLARDTGCPACGHL